MTEAQEKNHKRLNGLYGKLIQEEDYKGALVVQLQIIAFERVIDAYNSAMELKNKSPLR
jgi:hypothetical protein